MQVIFYHSTIIKIATRKTPTRRGKTLKVYRGYSKKCKDATKAHLCKIRASLKRKQITNSRKRGIGKTDTSCRFFVKLSLRELRSATCLLETVLLSFLDSGVAGQEAFLLEGGTAIGFCLKQSACDAETDCAGLTGIAAAVDVNHNVILALCAEKHEGLLYLILHESLREVIFESSVIYYDSAASCGNEAYSGNCLLSSARSPKLQLFL